MPFRAYGSFTLINLIVQKSQKWKVSHAVVIENNSKIKITICFLKYGLGHVMGEPEVEGEIMIMY